MTNNQQMLDVLKSLWEKGWKFEEVCSKDKPFSDNSISWYIAGADDGLFILDDIQYESPTILEAEAVIDKMAHYWGFEKSFPSIQTMNKTDGYRYDSDQHIKGEIYHRHTHFDAPYTEPKRLLAVLQLADKLAEAEPDKFKLIFEEK